MTSAILARKRPEPVLASVALATRRPKYASRGSRNGGRGRRAEYRPQVAVAGRSWKAADMVEDALAAGVGQSRRASDTTQCFLKRALWIMRREASYFR